MTENAALAIVLSLSVVVQTAAAWFAIRQMTDVVGKFRLAWGCVALALALMIERRIVPLWRLTGNGKPSDLPDAAFGLAVSLLMALGVFGLRRLFTHLRELALTDSLTGLSNRRDTLQRAQVELDRAARSRRNVAFVLFDIDHFKRFNDAHGHAAGDLVLRSVADAFREGFRNVDTVGRIGGEEFLAVLPESDLDNAVGAVERVLQAISRKELRMGNRVAHVTISAGLSVWGMRMPFASLEDMLKEADAALYVAKERGRNRLVVSPRSSTS